MLDHIMCKERQLTSSLVIGCLLLANVRHVVMSSFAELMFQILQFFVIIISFPPEFCASLRF